MTDIVLSLDEWRHPAGAFDPGAVMGAVRDELSRMTASGEIMFRAGSTLSLDELEVRLITPIEHTGTVELAQAIACAIAVQYERGADR